MIAGPFAALKITASPWGVYVLSAHRFGVVVFLNVFGACP